MYNIYTTFLCILLKVKHIRTGVSVEKIIIYSPYMFYTYFLNSHRKKDTVCNIIACIYQT